MNENINKFISDGVKKFFINYHDCHIDLSPIIKNQNIQRISKRTVRIPLRYKNKDIARLQIRSFRSEIKDTDILKISKAAELLIGYPLFAHIKKEKLQRIYLEIEKNENPNVIPINRNLIQLRRQKDLACSRDFENSHDLARSHDNSSTQKIYLQKFRITRRHTLIEGSDPEDIFKMALEIYKLHKGYGFISIENLDKHTKTNSEELMKLGFVTIFIKELRELSLDQSHALLDILNCDPQESPAFLVGNTNKSFLTKLASDEKSKIHQKIYKKLFSGQKLLMKEKFSDYQRQGLFSFIQSRLKRD